MWRFRIICAGDAPDHTVLARFRQEHQQALEGLLTQTLLLCAELGMVRLGVLAFDGTEIAADATFTEAHLRRLAAGFLTEVEATDDAEDGRFGPDTRGDEPPVTVRDHTGRAARLDAALEQIQRRRAVRQREVDQREAARREAAQRHEDRRQQARAGREQQRREAARAYERTLVQDQVATGRPPRGTDSVLRARMAWERQRRKAEQRYEAWNQRVEQARQEGRTHTGRPSRPPDEHGNVLRTTWAAYQAAATAQEQQEQQRSTEGPSASTGPDSQASEPSDASEADLPAEQAKANLPIRTRG